jgi:hypothetical protein
MLAALAGRLPRHILAIRHEAFSGGLRQTHLAAGS